VRRTAPTRVVEVEPLLVTIDQAAAMLNVGRTTMYGLVGTGVIPTVRIGSCRRIAVEALEHYVAGLAEGTST